MATCKAKNPIRILQTIVFYTIECVIIACERLFLERKVCLGLPSGNINLVESLLNMQIYYLADKRFTMFSKSNLDFPARFSVSCLSRVLENFIKAYRDFFESKDWYKSYHRPSEGIYPFRSNTRNITQKLQNWRLWFDSLLLILIFPHLFLLFEPVLFAPLAFIARHCVWRSRNVSAVTGNYSVGFRIYM